MPDGSGLAVEGIHKAFGTERVLEGVDLSVPGGAIVALLGTSGSGKSTLLRLIAGFDRPDAGRIAVGGVPVAGPGLLVPPERRRIGLVPQEGALFPHLTVARNVGFGLPRGPDRDRRVAAMLELTGLGGLEARFPHQLSGGQIQRAALARALAPAPRIVLLDEPFNALDLALRRSTHREVSGLLREIGSTAILVTHDPVEAFGGADLVAAIHGGRVAQCADPATIYRQPASAAVARLTGPVVTLPARAGGKGAVTALGYVELASDPAPGCAALEVLARPEQVVLAPGGAAGVVTDRVFAGDHVELAVRVGGLSVPFRWRGPDVPETGAMLELGIAGACPAFPEGGGSKAVR